MQKTIEEWRKLYGRGYVVKDRGYSYKNETQWIFFSELLMTQDGVKIPRKSQLVFIIGGLPRILSQSLQNDLANYAIGKSLPLPSGVHLTETTTFAVDVNLLTIDSRFIEESKEDVFKADEPIPSDEVNFKSDEFEIIEKDIKLESELDSFYTRILGGTIDNFIQRPTIVEDFKFFNSLLGLDLHSFELVVDMNSSEMENEESFVKLLTSLIILYKIKHEKNI